MPDKERLISLLASVQMCTRCGKCKQVCPMMYPECSYHFHPRNKNMVLGAIIEAIYYSQINKGRPDPSILAALHGMRPLHVRVPCKDPFRRCGVAAPRFP